MKKKVHILVGICSCLEARARRDAVRRTWLRYKQQGIECAFFVGGSGPFPEGEREDMIPVDAADGYHELPAKVFAFFRHVLDNYDFDWIFKCDDDTYVDLARLSEVALPGYDLIGDVLVDVRKAPSGGAGYFLSRTMVKKLLSLPALPSTGAEDLIIGELVFKLGGKALATNRLYMSNVYYPDLNNDMVTAHWCTPEIMEAIHVFNHGRPDAVCDGMHPYWTDELLFFSNGNFRRKSTSCYGRWSLRKKGQLELKWQMWPEEQLLWRDGCYVGSETKLTFRTIDGRLPEDVEEGSTELGDRDEPYVHLGCGKKRLMGWLNLDEPNYDITSPLPWRDNAIEAYFLEHGAERLTALQTFDFLREVWRTLKPGGVLRLVLTDVAEFRIKQTPAVIQFLKEKYRKKGAMQTGAIQMLMLNANYISLWTAESMSCVLEEIGFTVTREPVGSSSHPHLQGLEDMDDGDENPFNRIGTVCLEATKGKKSSFKPTHLNKKSYSSPSRGFVTPRFLEGHRTGNRLFQIAAVYAHALRHGLECRIPWRHSQEVSDLFDYLGESASCCPNGGYHEPVTYRERSFSYNPIPSSVQHGALEGFFQSERYFNDAMKEVRAMFRPLTAPRCEGVAGVHIRMGDYMERTDMYHIPDASFLSAAFTKFSDNIRELVVFSDTPDKALELVKKVPEAKRFEVSLNRHETLRALRELSSMQELVLSCSSFSWWGAWLGEQSRVMIQKNWFAGRISDDHDVFLPSWLRL